jgi:WD40 repeat protein
MLLEVDEPWTVRVAFSPDGLTLATTGQHGLRFWNTKTGKPKDAIRSSANVNAVAYSPDGLLLATGDNSADVTVWDYATGKERWSAHVSGPWRLNFVALVSALLGLGLSLLAGLNLWKGRQSATPNAPVD